eukprot:5102159-Prymnesium_polylepis.1
MLDAAYDVRFSGAGLADGTAVSAFEPRSPAHVVCDAAQCSHTTHLYVHASRCSDWLLIFLVRSERASGD